MNELLELVLSAHGGLERWREVQTIDLKLSITGGLFRIKGFPEGLPNVSMHIEAQRPAVNIAPYKTSDGRGYFTPSRVWIEDGEGRIIEERDDPRASIAGHVRATQWDQLQRLYFSSYAMWNYLTTSFLFAQPGFEVCEIEPHQENGEIWRSLHVKFPSDVPTHCAEQTFFFSEKGLLRRLDYVTDIAGGVGSHYCFDHETFGGLVFPTLRRVVARTPKLSLSEK